MTYKSLLELSEEPTDGPTPIEASAPMPAVMHDQILADRRAADPDVLADQAPDDAAAYEAALTDARQAIVAEILDTTTAPEATCE